MTARVEFLNGRVTLMPGDCMEVMPTLPVDRFDSVVCDPPYHLTSIVKRFGKEGAAPAQHGKDGAFVRQSAGFMNRTWDGGDIAFRPETWAEVYRVMKPGAYLLAFSSSRTFGRMQVAIEDAGFITHPFIAWIFASGFPKAHRVKAEGWEGWRYGGQALKPAIEPIYMGQKPFSEETGTANVLKHGTGAINVGACRVPIGANDLAEMQGRSGASTPNNVWGNGIRPVGKAWEPASTGRWPANVVTDGSHEVEAAFAAFGTSKSNHIEKPCEREFEAFAGGGLGGARGSRGHDDAGTASRFFVSFPLRETDLCRSTKFANDAERTSDAGNKDDVSVLRNAVERSTVGLVLKSIGCPEPYTSVTEAELRHACANVTTLIQNIAQKFWRGLPLESSTLTSGAVRCAATLKQIDTTTITVSLSIFVGCAEFVTFGITLAKPELGALGSAATRFHYTSKADSDSRIGSSHPTIKPLDLIQYLVRLITPPNGLCLDPFAGTGTTGEAAFREGMRAVLIEREPAYLADIERRMKLALGGAVERRHAIVKAKGKVEDAGPLFGGAA